MAAGGPLGLVALGWRVTPAGAGGAAEVGDGGAVGSEAQIDLAIGLIAGEGEGGAAAGLGDLTGQEDVAVALDGQRAAVGCHAKAGDDLAAAGAEGGVEGAVGVVAGQGEVAAVGPAHDDGSVVGVGGGEPE